MAAMQQAYLELSDEEWQQLCATFQQIDKNHDGQLDANEVETTVAQMFPGAPQELICHVRDVLLKGADTNLDGKVDFHEFLVFVTEKLQELQGLQQQQQPPDAQNQPEAAHSTITDELSTEELDVLRDTFIKLDRDGDGFVTRTDLMEAVREVVAERFVGLRPYLEKIFDVADTDNDDKLNLTDFLSSFAEGPGALPQEVVMACVAKVRVRLSDEEVESLQETFGIIDRNHDSFIDKHELHYAIKQYLAGRFPDLSSKTVGDIVKTIMQSADTDRDGKLNMSEFIRSFQEDQGVLPAAFIDGSFLKVSRPLTRDQVASLKEAFSALDRNNDGYLDYAEMFQAVSGVLSTALPNQEDVRDVVNLIMVTADRNKDGKLTLTEFMRNFVLNEDIMSVPLRAAEERIRHAKARLEELMDNGELVKMVTVFEWLDKNRDGYLQPNELNELLVTLLKERYPDWAEQSYKEVIDALFSAADTDNDGRISLQEFIESFVEGYGVLPPEVVSEMGTQLRRELTTEELDVVIRTFKEMDADKDGFVSREELSAALAQALGSLITDFDHLQKVTDFVMEKVDLNADGRVSLREFITSFELDQGVLPVVAAESEAQHADPMAPVEQPAQGEPAAPHEDAAAPPVAPARDAQPKATDVAPATASATTTPTKGALVVAQAAATPQAAKVATPRSPFVNDVSGVAVSDQQLRAEFAKYDKHGTGKLDKEEFKRAYMQMENFGLEPLPREVDVLFDRYAGKSSFISFDAFSVLMLHRAKM